MKPLAKTVLLPLGLTAVASATDAFKRILMDQELQHRRNGRIVKSLEESRLLIKGFSEKNKNEAK